MLATLRALVLPALRQRGFAGDLPHLRRAAAAGTWTFSSQVSKWGGEFIIELGRAPAGPYTARDGALVPPAELTSFHLRLAQRARLCADADPAREVWFRYSPTLPDRARQQVGELVGRPLAPDPCERAARQVLELLPECDRWWQGEAGLPHVRSMA